MGFHIHITSMIVHNRESNQCVKNGVTVLPCDSHFVLMHKYQHKLSANPSLDLSQSSRCQNCSTGIATWMPLEVSKISGEQQICALSASLMFLKEKRTEDINGWACRNGAPQHAYIPKEDATLPTVSTESTFVTATIATTEKRKVQCYDVPSAFVSTEVDKDKIMVLKGDLADMMVQHRAADCACGRRILSMIWMVDLISAGCGIPSPWIVHTPSMSNGIVFICKAGWLEQMRWQSLSHLPYHPCRLLLYVSP